jgi:hypothetical protein
MYVNVFVHVCISLGIYMHEFKFLYILSADNLIHYVFKYTNINVHTQTSHENTFPGYFSVTQYYQKCHIQVIHENKEQENRAIEVCLYHTDVMMYIPVQTPPQNCPLGPCWGYWGGGLSLL